MDEVTERERKKSDEAQRARKWVIPEIAVRQQSRNPSHYDFRLGKNDRDKFKD